MEKQRVVLCADHNCKHNYGGGYYGACNNPIVNHPIYTGGVDRLLMNTCQLKETEDGRIIITGGGRGGGKIIIAEAMKKYMEEHNVCFEIDRRTG